MKVRFAFVAVAALALALIVTAAARSAGSSDSVALSPPAPTSSGDAGSIADHRVFDAIPEPSVLILLIVGAGAARLTPRRS